MAVYLEKYKGYIADNPNLDFERCDGKVFSYDEVNTASVSNTANSITVNGGQGAFPLAYIDTDKTMEITFSSSDFDLDMFSMANATNETEGDFGTRESRRFDVVSESSALKITLPYECKAGSVKIRGLEEADTAAAGKFTVAITAAAASTDGKTVITFYTGDVAEGDTVRVSFIRRIVDSAKVAVKTTGTTCKGELWAHWPIYSSGTDCTEASIKAWLHLHMYRVRATALPGFDSSYKSAQTFSVTFSGLDPKRADGRMYEMEYEPLDADGNIVAKSDADVDWD